MSIICTPSSARRPQVLFAFKKAVELNGKPEVYAPLASCAEAVVGWMRVRGWGWQTRVLTGQPEGENVARTNNSDSPANAT